jgi:hypothetical protein
VPDLNQIKQGEQGRATGARGSPRVSPVYGNRRIRPLFSRGQPRAEPEDDGVIEAGRATD